MGTPVDSLTEKTLLFTNLVMNCSNKQAGMSAARQDCAEQKLLNEVYYAHQGLISNDRIQ